MNHFDMINIEEKAEQELKTTTLADCMQKMKMQIDQEGHTGKTRS